MNLLPIYCKLPPLYRPALRRAAAPPRTERKIQILFPAAWRRSHLDLVTGLCTAPNYALDTRMEMTDAD